MRLILANYPDWEHPKIAALKKKNFSVKSSNIYIGKYEGFLKLRKNEEILIFNKTACED